MGDIPTNNRMRKATIQGKFYDVVSLEEYQNHPDLYCSSMTAVDISRVDGSNIILPYRSGNPSDDRPGIYKLEGLGDLMVLPENEEEYKPTDMVSFDHIQDIQEYTERCAHVRSMECDTLTCTDPSKHYHPPISGKESPEMRGLKDAIMAKGIDIDQYADRFGDNFPNDKRQLKSDSITLFMLKRFCRCLDMKAELIIEDSNTGVPNPIGDPIVIDLFGNNDDENNE